RIDLVPLDKTFGCCILAWPRLSRSEKYCTEEVQMFALLGDGAHDPDRMRPACRGLTRTLYWSGTPITRRPCYSSRPFAKRACVSNIARPCPRCCARWRSET